MSLFESLLVGGRSVPDSMRPPRVVRRNRLEVYVGVPLAGGMWDVRWLSEFEFRKLMVSGGWS